MRLRNEHLNIKYRLYNKWLQLFNYWKQPCVIVIELPDALSHTGTLTLHVLTCCFAAVRSCGKQCKVIAVAPADAYRSLYKGSGIQSKHFLTAAHCLCSCFLFLLKLHHYLPTLIINSALKSKENAHPDFQFILRCFTPPA